MGPDPAANTSSSANTTTAASVPSAMSAPSPSIEQLPTNIPRLEPNGVNWVIFSMRFWEAMQATHRWDYFDGSKPHPEPKDKDKPMDAETEARDKWDYKDLIARYLLSQHLPDTTTIRVSGYSTVKERWEKVSPRGSRAGIPGPGDT